MNELRSVIVTEKAPKGRGPFPQALRVGEFVFVSGQGPLDPTTSVPISGTFSQQVDQTFDNLEAILAAAGIGLADLAKVTVYLSDLGRVPEFNALYEARIPAPFPARTLVQAGLRGIDVELDVIAVRSRPAAAERAP
ncbi:MAG TPA: Rid family hydrolase [Roseiarcus sp.]|jgi:2-iminobutanoate/2-iminopropanoate deaminase